MLINPDLMKFRNHEQITVILISIADVSFINFGKNPGNG